MKRCWNEQELVEHWTLFEAEAALLTNRTGRGRIGLAVLLKYFQLNGRFPRRHRDVPGPVLAFLGECLSVTPTAWFEYDLGGRSGKRDREQVGVVGPNRRKYAVGLDRFDPSGAASVPASLDLSASYRWHGRKFGCR